MLEFLRSRAFVFNFLGAIAAICLFGWFGAFLLSSYTQHGQTITVPDLSGKKIADVKKMLDSRQLEFKVIDSSYSAKLLPLTVIDQNPKPNSKVKEERTIYLTINALNPPKIKMPDLKDASMKQAQMVLESYGLKVGRLIYKPDLAQNAVLDQQVNGKTIEPGTMIAKGSSVDLILGDGLGQTEIEVPNLVGLTLTMAKFVLEGVGLNLGSVVGDSPGTNAGSEDALIYKQVPDPKDDNNQIKQGEAVDVFITFDSSKIPEEMKAPE